MFNFHRGASVQKKILTHIGFSLGMVLILDGTSEIGTHARARNNLIVDLIKAFD